MSQDLIGTLLPNIEFENIDINEYNSGGGKVLSLRVTFSLLENITKDELTWSSLPDDLLENIKINIVGFINEPEQVNNFQIYSILDVSEEKKISSELKKIGTKVTLKNFNPEIFEIIEKNGKRYKKITNTILFETFPEEVVTDLSFMSYCYYDFNNPNEKDIFGRINIVKLIENGKTRQRRISYFEVVSGLEFFGNPINLNDRLVSYTDNNIELERRETPISVLTDYRIKKSLGKVLLDNLNISAEEEKKYEGYFSNIFLSTTLKNKSFETLDDLLLNGYFFFDYEKFSRDNFKFKNVVSADPKTFNFKVSLFAEENKKEILLEEIKIKKVPFITESREISADTQNLFLVNFKGYNIFKELRGNYKIKVVAITEDRTVSELVKNYLNLIKFNSFLKDYADVLNKSPRTISLETFLEKEKTNLKNLRTEVLKSVKNINKLQTNILEQDNIEDILRELFEGIFKNKIKIVLESQEVIKIIINAYEKYLGKKIIASIATTPNNNIAYKHIVKYEHNFSEEIIEKEFKKVLFYNKNENKAKISSNIIKEFIVEDYQKILNSATSVLELLKNNTNIIQDYNELLDKEEKFTAKEIKLAIISSLDFLKNKDFLFNKSDLPTSVDLSKNEDLLKELIYLNLVFNVSYETKYLKTFKVNNRKILLKKEIWDNEPPTNLTIVKNEKFKLPLNISETYKNSFILKNLNLNIIDKYLAEI